MFLRETEQCLPAAHPLITDPVKDVEVINTELESFGAGLERKPTIMAASKIDVGNKEKLAKLKRYCRKEGLPLFPISAVTGKGIEVLKYAIAEKVEQIRREAVAAAQEAQNASL